MTFKERGSYCAGCIYYKGVNAYSKTCDYLLDTGIIRPCPPGEGCTVRTAYKKRTWKRRKKKEGSEP